MAGTLLSLGHGYSAGAFGSLLTAQGWTVIGTTRDREKAAHMARGGVEPLIWPGTPLPLDRATHLLTSIAPGHDVDPVLALAAKALKAATHLKWVGYLSTTAVYGDHGGGWVDENTTLAPASQRAHARVKAEAGWGALGLPLHIFRLAGIYGPGRGPFQKIRNGTARRIIKENQVFSRIHIDDIAQTLMASINRPKPGAIYNLCDDDPAPPQDVIAHAAELLGLPIPPEIPFETAEMTSMARSFYGESKRVRNDRIKDELGVSLHYPTYRAGLRALLDIEG